jgi:HK97 family phage prohead protease
MSEFLRALQLDDIRIRSGGDGRTVEAYAAVFDDPAEVVDQDGHYLEQNHRASFDRTIAHQRGRFPIVYHHGLTVAGTPSERGSVPIGVSTEVRTDAKGVLTVATYGRSELADEVLEAIRNGSISGQSYGGRYLRSDPQLRRGQRYSPGRDGALRTVTRLEVALREFGPTPFPTFAGASILGVRAALLADLAAVGVPSPQHVGDATTPRSGDPASSEGTPAGTRPPAPEDPPLNSGRHSTRGNDLSARIRAARIVRGIG